MQTQYQDIGQLAWAVEEARKARRDLIADTRQLHMTDSGELGVHGIGGEAPMPVNDHAHGQIAARLQIPKPYYDRMRREAPGLLAENVNAWFQQKPERRMVRTMKGHVRAFLSDRYQRIDNDHVLAAIYPVLHEFPQLKYHSLALTENRMYLKATLPTVRAEVNVGEIVEAGIEFRNGEIGNSRFEAWPFAYKLTCKNGMRMEVGGFSKMHVGGRADVTEEVYEMLSDETLQADDRAFVLKARDVVKATLAPLTFKRLVDKFRDATQDRISGNPAKAVEVLADSFGLGGEETGAVLRHLIEGGDTSRWGLANAITRAAQDVESYDRSDELEGLGGKLIELPHSQWHRIAEAA